MARRSSTTVPGVTGPASGESDSAGIGASVQMRPQRLSLSPAYRHVRDSILRPHLRITESRYFIGTERSTQKVIGLTGGDRSAAG